MDVRERIKKLRALMKTKNIDIYYIPNGDDHLSDEYTAPYFQAMNYMSGFTGGCGCLIVTQDFAGQWADGRYFTQAEGELEGSGIELMRMRQAGVPDAVDFLIDNTPEGGVLGYDGRIVSAGLSRKLNDALRKKNASLHVTEDLVKEIWEERPSMPSGKLFVLEEQYTGESTADRIARVRKSMEGRADALLLTKLEDPCWMLNIRGNDMPCTPVAYAFAMVTPEDVFYYISEEKVTEEVRKYLEENHVTIRPYEAVTEDLTALDHKTLCTDMSALNTLFYTCISEHENGILNETSPVVKFRAVKNPTELACTRNAHVKDAVAMVKFIKWVKENVNKGDMSELSAQDHLYELRAAQPDYIEPSFTTIAAYQANGAMMHYTATEENYAHVDPRGFLLVDSGGTYKDGSTDITRTISLGGLTDEEKKYYTLVLKGHLELSAAVYLYGTTGCNLDILARRPLWNLDIDYQCGTGHGVGHVLSVHEGPHGIRWGVPAVGKAPVLEAGMIVTNEPGVYIPHELGIRIENELVVREREVNFYGKWMDFETITYVPYDIDAIDPKYLDDSNIEQINIYHKMVYATVSPYLNEEEKVWLQHETREIHR